jgi:hypothetical protein
MIKHLLPAAAWTYAIFCVASAVVWGFTGNVLWAPIQGDSRTASELLRAAFLLGFHSLGIALFIVLLIVEAERDI